MNKKYISVFKKQSYSILLIFFSILTFVLIYNSCTDDVLYSKILNPFPKNFDIKINNGATFTKKLDVSLGLKVPEKDITHQKINFEMKISNKSDCTDGKWEPYIPRKDWVLSSSSNPGEKIEEELPVYVRFRERRYEKVHYTYRTEEFAKAKGESNCFRASIVRDNRAPRIKFTSTPTTTTESGQTTREQKANFQFTGEDYSAVSFQCKLAKGRNTSHIVSRKTNTKKGTPSLSSRKKDRRVARKTNTKKGTRSLSSRAVYRKPNSTGTAGWRDLVSWTGCNHSPLNTQKLGFLSSTPGSASYGESSLYLPLLDSGEYKFSVEATDEAGNVSIKDHTWKINSAAPGIVCYGGGGGGCPKTPGHSYIETIPIKIINAGKNPSIKCTINGTEYNCMCKSGNITQTCTTLYKPGQILEISDKSFYKSPLKEASSGYPQAVIDAYSGTNYYKEYTLHITVTNNDNSNSTSKGCLWKTIPRTKELEVVKAPTQSNKKQADILLIIDHSTIMSLRAEKLGRSFEDFVNSLEKDLNWQIAVASMEKSEANPSYYLFGQFLPIRKSKCPVLTQIPPSLTEEDLSEQELTNEEKQQKINGRETLRREKATQRKTDKTNYDKTINEKVTQFILTSSDSCSNPIYCSTSPNELQNIFINTMTCPLFDGAYEYGIRAVHEILNKHRRRNPYLNFFRETATFVAIFLTDSKNCQDDSDDHCTAGNKPNQCNGYKDYRTTESDFPDDLIQKVKCVFGDDKKFLAYPIVPDTFGPNEDYIDLAMKTQGTDENNVIRVNIEGESYTNELKKIGDHIVTITTKALGPICSELKTLGPIYSFKPTNGTFTTMNTPETPMKSPDSTLQSTHYFKIDDTTHYVNIEKQGTQVKFTPVVSPPNNLLPDGTYRVDYLCNYD